ncbi:MAG: hypothetical protein KAI79_01740, partial [Bacteroidales bacterium]|nr:hypothetical protein [Bacteroidales bacterium]
MSAFLLLFLTIGGVTNTYAQDSQDKGTTIPKMKMTTEVPAGVATPDKLETSIGTLTSFDGVPDAKTTQLVYD